MHCALVTLAVLAALSTAGVQAGNDLSLSRGESLLFEPLCTSDGRATLLIVFRKDLGNRLQQITHLPLQRCNSSRIFFAAAEPAIALGAAACCAKSKHVDY
jgi:hypothetical protein